MLVGDLVCGCSIVNMQVYLGIIFSYVRHSTEHQGFWDKDAMQGIRIAGHFGALDRRSIAWQGSVAPPSLHVSK